jgi:hypothetical protein
MSRTAVATSNRILLSLGTALVILPRARFSTDRIVAALDPTITSRDLMVASKPRILWTEVPRRIFVRTRLMRQGRDNGMLIKAPNKAPNLTASPSFSSGCRPGCRSSCTKLSSNRVSQSAYRGPHVRALRCVRGFSERQTFGPDVAVAARRSPPSSLLCRIASGSERIGVRCDVPMVRT